MKIALFLLLMLLSVSCNKLEVEEIMEVEKVIQDEYKIINDQGMTGS